MKLDIACILAGFLFCSLFVSPSVQGYDIEYEDVITCAEFESGTFPFFRCTTGNRCIVYYFECDSFGQCEDFSDEDHCEAEHAANCINDFADKVTSTGEPLQSWQCDNKMCILGCRRCDGNDDCADSSDEAGCTDPNEVIPPCQ